MDVLGATVIVVDDDEQVLRMIAKVLTRRGYRSVHTTSHPDEVLEMCRELKPDLMLLDLNMPGVSGFEILKATRNQILDFEPIPVVVLTGERGRDSRIEALELGAQDYIVKPFDFEVLARIKNLLERRLLAKHLHFQNCELEERVQERTAELRKAQIETVRRLGLAAEYRDDDTGVHVLRIAAYAHIMALAMGQDDQAAERTALAAKLHDVGKLGIPDSILLKPGKLEPHEFDVIKQHTVIGAKILSGAGSELLKLAEVIALNHHEKWDGSGYPSGKKGEEIPEVARMVAVIDVFDALTSSRPYKRAWPVEEAVAEIERGRGKHFDPAMVDLFFDRLEEIKSVREDTPDL